MKRIRRINIVKRKIEIKTRTIQNYHQIIKKKRKEEEIGKRLNKQKIEFERETKRNYSIKQYLRNDEEPIGEDAGLAILLLGIATGFYYGLKKLVKRIQSERESKEWPTTTGEIKYICYRRSQEHPSVTYVYRVMGKLYTSHRLRPRVIQNVPLVEKAPEYKLLARTGDYIPVYYNPADPTDAVIIPTDKIAIPDVILAVVTGMMLAVTGIAGAKRMTRFLYRYKKNMIKKTKNMKKK